MTGKRFTVNYRENTRLYEVKDNLHILDCGGFAIECNAKKCCEELNALHEENTKLKKDFDSCSHNWAIMYDEAKNKVGELSKENKQLKQRITELELLNDGLNYALKNIRKIDVEIDVGDVE